MRHHVLLPLCGWLFVSIAVHAPALGDTSQEQTIRARTLQTEGLRLLDRGDAAGALLKFGQAFALVPSPKIQFNMGRAHELLGHDAEGFRSFDRFLREAENVPAQARVEAERSRERLRRKLSFLTVTGPSGSELFVDDASRGVLPLESELVIEPGRHEVRLQREQREIHRQTIETRPGAATTVSVSLEVQTVIRDPSPAPAVAAPTAPAPSTVPLPQPLSTPTADGSTTVQSAAEPQPQRWMRPAAWTSAALSAGALTFAVFQLVRSNQRFDSFNKTVYAPATPDHRCTRAEPMAGGGECEATLSEADGARGLAVGGFVAAGALAAAATTLFVLSSPGSTPTRGAVATTGGWTCHPHFGQWGASCAARF